MQGGFDGRQGAGGERGCLGLLQEDARLASLHECLRRTLAGSEQRPSPKAHLELPGARCLARGLLQL